MRGLLVKNGLSIALISAVCVFVVIAHWPALSAKALSFDDDQYVTENELVQNPSWASAKRFLTEVFAPSTVGGYYQPLTMISLMLDYAMGGRENNLLPFHCTSLFLHTANTVLVIVLLHLLFGNIWIASAVGLLFGIHPMTVESVAWIGDRKTVLAAFFSFWSLLFYVLFTRKGGKKYYVACLVAYLLALMSKPTSTFLPFVMLLMDFWPLNRLSWKSVREKISFFVLFIVFSVITFISQASAGGSLPGQQEHSWLNPPLIICHNIVFYPFKMLWPVNLTSHYVYPQPFTISNPVVLADVVAAVILIILLIVSQRWTKAALTGALIFFVAIFPTMQIFKFSDVIASDKFAYLPSVGLLIILAYFLLWIYKNKLSRALIIGVVVLLLAGAEGIQTRRYLVCWKDTISLFKHMLDLAPNSASMHCSLAAKYIHIGQYDKAIELLNRAIAIDSTEGRAYFNLGIVYFRLNRYNESRDVLQKAVRFSPKCDTYTALGEVYAALGEYDMAVSFLKQAIAVNPSKSQAYFILGKAYLRLNRYQDSIDILQKAISISPKYTDAYIVLGFANASLGKFREEIAACKKAIELDPCSSDAYILLGSAYGKLNQFPEALEAYKQAERIAPQNPQVRYGLGFFYLKTGDKDSALKQYEILKQIDPARAEKLRVLITK